MSKRILLAFCILCSLLLACSKSESINSETNSAKATPEKPVAPPTNDASTSTNLSAGDKIGVPECDQFIANYEACLNDKVPAASREKFQTGLAEWRAAWKRLAANPQGKTMLETACKNAAEQTRAQMKAYNCTF